MTRYDEMTRIELVAPLRAQESAPSTEGIDGAPDSWSTELQARQVELEMENRTLRDGQQALEDARSRYAELFELAPVGYVTLDREGRILDANLAASTLLKAERGVLLGRALSTVVALQDRRALREHLKACFTEKTRVTTELALSARERGEIHVQIVSTPTLGADGNVIGCRSALTDISSLKQSQASLKFLAGASDALSHSLDYSTTLATVTRVAVPVLADVCSLDLLDDSGQLRRLGFASADPRRDPIAARVSSSTALLLETSPQARVVRTREPLLVSEAVRDDGIAGADSAIIVPLVAYDRALGALTLARIDSGRRYTTTDLTVARELADRAAIAIHNAQLYDAAQMAIRAREDILAIVAHDLRNPLGSILLSADFLLSSSPTNERRRGRKQIEAIKRGATRMVRMINDLLDLSSIESGHLAIDRAENDVAELVDDVLEIFTPLGRQRRIEMYGDCHSCRGARVLCDRERVLQVFSNLVGNALKFTPEGGSIRLAASIMGSEAQFSVTDTGPGIGKAQLRHLFDRYWQAKETAKKGQGLGLFIAKGIVEAQGGRIWAESEVGVGTTLHFTLPLCSAREDSTHAPSTRSLRAASTGSVLIVDDEPDSREIVGLVLEMRGYSVARSANGREALDYLKSTDELPSIILLDLNMPVMDGRELVSTVKKDRALASIPIVLVSSDHDLADEQEALGARAALEKPVHVDQLLETVMRYGGPPASSQCA
jgi:PAS domain S-box-containing protein